MGTENLLKFDRAAGRLKEVAVEVGAATSEQAAEVNFPLSHDPIAVDDAVSIYLSKGLRIDGFVLHSDTAAGLVVDVRSILPENMPSQVGDSICGTSLPELQNAHFVQSSDLVDWLRAIPAGTVLVAKVTAADGSVRNATLQLVGAAVEGDYPILVFSAPEATDFYSYVEPSVYYSSEDVNQYPTYVQAPNADFPLPQMVFDGGNVEQYPTYVQASYIPLVFEAGVDDGGTQWVKYSRSFAPSSGAPIYAYLVTGLPLGLVATYDDGVNLVISGIPEVSGTFPISIEVTDRAGRVVSDSYSIVIAAATKAPVIEMTFPDSFAAGVVGYIEGYNFGTVAGQVFVDGVDHSANVLSWSDTEIFLTIPTGVADPSDIYVVAGGISSNTISRRIIAA